jgi:hypothetical protein
VADQLDAVLFQALEGWWQAIEQDLATRGVAASLQGPLEAPGMDPVFILHLETDRWEKEACLFRGGLLLLSCLNKMTAENENSSINAATTEDLIVGLDELAGRA